MKNLRQLLSMALVVFTPVTAVAGEPGTAGALFLRVGMGARAGGMGEAYTAVAEDASATYWNPGAMAAVLGTNVTLMHSEQFQSIRVEQGALTHETDIGTFGFSFTGQYMDEMDRYEDTPSAAPLGTFSAHDLSFAVGYSRYVIPNLSAGITAKTVHQNIDQTTANGLAFDIGLYHITRWSGVKLGLVFANVGPPLHFADERFSGEEFDLPRTARVAVSYERKIQALRGGILAALDGVFPNDGKAKQHLGAEYNYQGNLFLRAGYKAGYDSQGTTLGTGVSYRKFSFDYAVLLIANDLGDTHRLGLTFKI
jgi:hypothetical protein